MKRLYYDPEKTSAFATVQKLEKPVAAANENAKKKIEKKPSEIKECLLKQDAYAPRGTLRKSFTRSPCTLNVVDL
jgi:hypothetical protein